MVAKYNDTIKQLRILLPKDDAFQDGENLFDFITTSADRIEDD